MKLYHFWPSYVRLSVRVLNFFFIFVLFTPRSPDLQLCRAWRAWRSELRINSLLQKKKHVLRKYKRVPTQEYVWMFLISPSWCFISKINEVHVLFEEKPNVQDNNKFRKVHEELLEKHKALQSCKNSKIVIKDCVLKKFSIEYVLFAHIREYHWGNRSILRKHFWRWWVVQTFDFNADKSYFLLMRW